MAKMNLDTGLSADSEQAINRLYDKKNQQRLAGMTSSDTSELTGDVTNIIKADVRNKAALQGSAIGSELKREELDVRREDLNAQRLTAKEELAQQQQIWGTEMGINERRYGEQMKDAKLQRKIGNITTGASALGTVAGATYTNTWGDTIRSWFSGFGQKQSPSASIPITNYTKYTNKPTYNLGGTQ